MTCLCLSIASILPICAPVIIGLGDVDLCKVANCFYLGKIGKSPLFRPLDKPPLAP